jgi:hypothetical protein
VLEMEKGGGVNVYLYLYRGRDLLIDGIDELKSIAEDKSSYLHIPSSLKIIHTLSLY